MKLSWKTIFPASRSMLSPYMGPRSEGLQGSSTPKDLETALQLTYAYVTEPRKDKAVFEGIVTKSKAGLANRSSDPKSVFSDTVTATFIQ